LLILSTNPASYDFNGLILTAVLVVDYLLNAERRQEVVAVIALYAFVCFPLPLDADVSDRLADAAGFPAPVGAVGFVGLPPWGAGTLVTPTAGLATKVARGRGLWRYLRGSRNYGSDTQPTSLKGTAQKL
jgi:hypothetical protein